MEESIKEIVIMEWRMLDTVKNIGGRAACQDDFCNFSIARTAELLSWDKQSRTNYYHVLLSAEEEGRNLYTEKYAYMMEYSSPCEYKDIKHLLPKVSAEKTALISEICRIKLKWAEDFAKQYPYIGTQTRPIYSNKDTPNLVSVETFMKGTLKTYSTDLLESYLSHIKMLNSLGENIVEIVAHNTMKKYGFKSLKDADEKIKQVRTIG